MTNKAIEQLQQLGFSQYEAQAYLALLKQNPLNGYELAKASGIPRPNIYSVLQKLEEHGAVLRLESPEGVRYTPIASEELVERLRRQFQASLEGAQKSLQELSCPQQEAPVWNIGGYQQTLAHAVAAISTAERRLLVAIWPPEAKVLAGDLQAAQKRGVEITTLCMGGCSQPCPACLGHVHRHAMPSAERWLVLVPDEAELIAAEISQDDQAHAVRTRQRMLVAMAGWYIRNTIALAAVVKDVGSELDHLLSDETRESLAGLYPENGQDNWLSEIKKMIVAPVVEESSNH